MTRAELIAAMDAAGIESGDRVFLDVPDIHIWDMVYGEPKEVYEDENGNGVIVVAESDY